MRAYLDEQQTKNFKAEISELFRALRKKGFMAKQNYWCCGGCAMSAAGQEAEEQFNKGKAYESVALFHKQEAARIREGSDRCHIMFDSLIDNQDQAEVGKIIHDTAVELGMVVEWNGNPAYRVVLYSREGTYNG